MYFGHNNRIVHACFFMSFVSLTAGLCLSFAGPQALLAAEAAAAPPGSPRAKALAEAAAEAAMADDPPTAALLVGKACLAYVYGLQINCSCRTNT